MTMAAHDAVRLPERSWLDGLAELADDLLHLQEGRHLTEAGGTRVGRMVARLMAMAPESVRHIQARAAFQAAQAERQARKAPKRKAAKKKAAKKRSKAR